MLVKKKAIVLALLTTCCGGANAIVTSTLNQKLVEQAQYWLQRGRDDNAADAWRKLLKLEPNNTDAIANLAIFEAESGHAELAKSYFSKLKQLQPDHPQIADVESAIRKGTSGKARIAEARQLAMQGKPDEAIERYQMAGSPDKLKGDAALEYFQVLSGTLLGYDDAKAGLERLVKENPGNNRYAYALAQVYTYRAPSRSEGIRMLADLSKKPEVAKQAEDSWRQALSWLGGKKEDEKFLIAYLDRHPDDKVIKDRLAEIRKENKAVPLVNKVAVSQHNASEKKEETEERTQPVSKPQLALNPAKPISHVDERSVNTIDTSTKNGKTAKTSTPEIIEETPAASTSASKLNNSTNEQAVVANADDQPSDGYTALKRGNLAEAETEFNYVLESAPDDAAALGGLGLVRMRQENFKAARELLGKAIEASPKTSKKLWKEAYDSAAYWALMQDARAERENGNNDQAIALMRKAIEINDLEPTGRLMLGDALMAADDPIGAEANYRGVLSDHKDNEQALFSLINLLRQQSRAKEADALIAKLTPEQKTLLNGGEDSKVADLREKAKQAEDAGDVVGAQTALEDAMLAAPNNVWIRLELARLYQRRNMPAQARSLLSGLLSAEPPLPDALYVSAMLSAEQQLWWEGMQTLEKIPEKARTKDMAALQKTMWIHVQMDRANVFAQQGNQRQANDILRQVEAVAGNSPEYVSVLAAGYIKNGDVGKGLSILRQALAKTAKPSLGLRLQYADALLRTRQDAELEPLIRQMYATPNLQQQEINALFNLRVALGIRQAEAAREEGNLAAAYDYIAPMLAESPDDNRLILSLARMYSSAGDTMQAAELFTKVLRTDPENQEAYQALVYAGIQIKDFDGAEANLNELLKRQPNNPRYVALAGRLARAKGNNSKALELFRQAMDLERTQPVT
ncbi:MAG: tetratricopeptide repeat protein, partial [Burkholderiales bacterium]|nr:tetratricopeptide repeat protein [Burkholderiales bacterium]